MIVGEKKKDKDLIVQIFYWSIKLHLNIYNNYVWAMEEKELLIKAPKNWPQEGNITLLCF